MRMHLKMSRDQIAATIKHQLDHGRYAPSKLYGDGDVARRIAAGIQSLTPYLQKRLHFTLEK